MTFAAISSLSFWLVEAKGAESEEQYRNPARYQFGALYLDRSGETGVHFGSRIGIGQIDNTPGLDRFRMQEWSEPAVDCSNLNFNCVAAGNITIFVPTGARTQGQTFYHRGYRLRILRCIEDTGNCVFEIAKEPAARRARSRIQNTGDPPIIYLRFGRSGVLSLGFSEVPSDPFLVSSQFRLSGSVGLFGRTSPRAGQSQLPTNPGDLQSEATVRSPRGPRW